MSASFDNHGLTTDDATSTARPHRFKGKTVAPRRAMQWLIACVCLWSLVLAPMEIATADGSMQILALIIAKLMLLCAGCCAIANIAPLRAVFVFLRAVSVFAVAPALLLEYAVSTALFARSLIDCSLKLALVVAYAIYHLRIS